MSETISFRIPIAKGVSVNSFSSSDAILIFSVFNFLSSSIYFVVNKSSAVAVLSNTRISGNNDFIPATMFVKSPIIGFGSVIPRISLLYALYDAVNDTTTLFTVSVAFFILSLNTVFVTKYRSRVSKTASIVSLPRIYART